MKAGSWLLTGTVINLKVNFNWYTWFSKRKKKDTIYNQKGKRIRKKKNSNPRDHFHTHKRFQRFISALKCKCLPCVSRVKVVQKTYWDWVGWTCPPTNQTSNEAKQSSIVQEIPARASDRLQADAKHVEKAKDPCVNAVASGSVVGSTGAFLNSCYDSSSSFQGIQNPSAVELQLSLLLYEWGKWAKTADFLSSTVM